MNPLPQRKKSAEEIAKLREELGIAGVPPPPPPLRGEMPAAAPAPVPLPPAVPLPPVLPMQAVVPVLSSPDPLPGIAPMLFPEHHESKPVRSLKRSERVPVLPVEGDERPARSSGPEPLASAIPLPAPKGVRSLRKSELGPLAPVHEPRPDSKLPQRRHSANQINDFRHREALSQLGTAPPPRPRAAHLAIVIPGYLLAAAGGIHFWFYDPIRQHPAVTMSCAGLAFLIAIWIFFRAPLSRHHAAFIAVIAFFTAIFGALYYFPQLTHGT